tara:strand:- start:224 stop:730 length:507 start_codon:yes stop_codon:yes gene_type:complete
MKLQFSRPQSLEEYVGQIPDVKSHTLLYGEMGVGKSTLGELLRDTYGYIFIDEIHKYQESILTLMGHGIVVGATKDLNLLCSDLKSKFVCHEVKPSEEDLETILLTYLGKEDYVFDRSIITKIVRASKLNTKTALRLFKRTQQYAKYVRDTNIISHNIVDYVIEKTNL